MARWYFCVIARSTGIARLATLVVLSLFVTLLLAGSAAAKDKFSYSVVIRPAGYSLTPDGSIQVGRIDSTKTYTLRLTLGGVAQPATNHGPGDVSRYVSAPTLAPGDSLTVEQPTGVTQETFTVPNVSMTATAGSPSLTGTAPDSGQTFATFDSICSLVTDDSYPVRPIGGTFSVTYPQAMTPGAAIRVTHFPGQGDRVVFENRVPGETPCLDVDGYQYPTGPGESPDPEPFVIRANDLRPSVTGARLVLRRGGVALVDYTDAAATSSVSKSTGVLPQPGDTLELYRPHTAGSPSYTFTIPAARATYDTSNSLVAIDAPAAIWIRMRVATQFQMWQNVRAAYNVLGGRTVFNFGVTDGIDPAISLVGREILVADWASADGRNSYSFGAAPGDLAPPVLGLILAKKFKFSKIRSSLSFAFNSSEASTASFKLTLPAKLKTSASSKSKPRTLATAKLSVAGGTTKVKLKLTKSGKKLIAKLRKDKYPPQTATLTVTATDASGNSATTTRTTKLARK